MLNIIIATGSSNVFTASASSGNSPVGVSAGDRVTILVSPNANNTMTDVSGLAYSAGILYIPS
jgi:hypothetical protein